MVITHIKNLRLVGLVLQNAQNSPSNNKNATHSFYSIDRCLVEPIYASWWMPIRERSRVQMNNFLTWFTCFTCPFQLYFISPRSNRQTKQNYSMWLPIHRSFPPWDSSIWPLGRISPVLTWLLTHLSPLLFYLIFSVSVSAMRRHQFVPLLQALKSDECDQTIKWYVICEFFQVLEFQWV